MPSTITTFHTFAAGTKARASQVNTNFSNVRGDFLPINENTASASDMTHTLGATDHRWAGAFLGYADFKANTTTAGVVVRADTAATAGALLIQIASITVAKVVPTGFDGAYMKPSSIPESALAFTYHMSITAFSSAASYSWTVPADGVLLTRGAGGGGGGGGGGTTGGGVVNAGGGGGGASGNCLISHLLSVTAGEVLSITVGSPGAIGAIAGNGSSGGATVIYRGGTAILTLNGGAGGAKGVNSSGGAGGGIYGGAGGTGATSAGTNGTSGITDGILTVAGGGGGGGGGAGSFAGATGGSYSFLGYAGGTPGNGQGGIAGGGGGGGGSIFAAGGGGGTRGGAPAGPFAGSMGSGGGAGAADGAGSTGGSGYIEFRYLRT